MPGTPVLAFLHTARPNIETFGALVARLDPSVPIRHALIEDVLSDAVDSGVVTDAMRGQTEEAVRALALDGARLVVCTCSTIGGIAEAVHLDGGPRVMRIDRPMAERAVDSGRRIVVAASLPSTIEPTTALLRQVAAEKGRGVDIVQVLCDGAWPHFERGDTAGYAEAIARAVTAAAGPEDIVVLAQASMAPAAALLDGRGIVALASPELGVREALAEYRRAGSAKTVRLAREQEFEPF